MFCPGQLQPVADCPPPCWKSISSTYPLECGLVRFDCSRDEAYPLAPQHLIRGHALGAEPSAHIQNLDPYLASQSLNCSSSSARWSAHQTYVEVLPDPPVVAYKPSQRRDSQPLLAPPSLLSRTPANPITWRPAGSSLQWLKTVDRYTPRLSPPYRLPRVVAAPPPWTTRRHGP